MPLPLTIDLLYFDAEVYSESKAKSMRLFRDLEERYNETI